MEIKLSQEDVELIADAVASKLLATQGKQEGPKPGTDLQDWVRGADLNKHIKMSKSTFLEYRDKGFIGVAKLGGCLYYYLPDIDKLLHSLYFKPEYIQDLEKKVRAELKKDR